MARMQYFGDFDTNSTGSAPNSSKKFFPTVVLCNYVTDDIIVRPQLTPDMGDGIHGRGL
jgi:hypothetical protein